MNQAHPDETVAVKKPALQAKLAARMHDPLQLRFALGLALLALWYFAGYTRMDARIASTTNQLDLDRKRLALAQEVESLRVEEAAFADRLPPRSDPNEFLQFILDGVRAFPVKLNSLIPEKPREAGPFQVASVKLDVEGNYAALSSLLQWVENNKRLLRVDSLKCDPDSRDDKILKIQIQILGLMGVEKVEAPKNAAKTNPKPKPTPKAGPAKPAAKAVIDPDKTS